VDREDTRNFFARPVRPEPPCTDCLASSVLPSPAIFVAVFTRSREPRKLTDATRRIYAPRRRLSRKTTKATVGGGGGKIFKGEQNRGSDRATFTSTRRVSLFSRIMHSLRSSRDGLRATGRENRNRGSGGDFILSSLGGRYVRITCAEGNRADARHVRGCYCDPRGGKNARRRGSNLSAGGHRLADIRGSFQSASLLLAGIV